MIFFSFMIIIYSFKYFNILLFWEILNFIYIYIYNFFKKFKCNLKSETHCQISRMSLCILMLQII
jgi:hypothetical protein